MAKNVKSAGKLGAKIVMRLPQTRGGAFGAARLASYFQLVMHFPLTCIRDDDHLVAAQRMIDKLLELDLDKGAEEYLDVLTNLVEAYENEHEPIPDVSEAEVLRELMRTNGISQQALSKAVGISQSTISAVLKGPRSLTKDQIVTLAKFFRVSPAAFLPA